MKPRFVPYCNGRYDRTDYSKQCDPPLQGDDVKWSTELLASAVKRPQ